MKTRLELAHDYLRDIISNWDFDDNFDPVAQAYEYADAMLAENEKREQEAGKKKRAEMRELLNANNTFVEKEGQHFDDVEWQPDWSVAPDWANWWSFDSESPYWWSDKPKDNDKTWFCYDVYWKCGKAPSFGYTSNWQDSLRKRPEGK